MSSNCWFFHLGWFSYIYYLAFNRFDMEGYVTGFGNPDWARTHSVAKTTAPTVLSVLKAGATCVGRTVMDEMAYRFVLIKQKTSIMFLSMWCNSTFLKLFTVNSKKMTILILTEFTNYQLLWLIQLLLCSHELYLLQKCQFSWLIFIAKKFSFHDIAWCFWQNSCMTQEGRSLELKHKWLFEKTNNLTFWSLCPRKLLPQFACDMCQWRLLEKINYLASVLHTLHKSY